MSLSKIKISELPSLPSYTGDELVAVVAEIGGVKRTYVTPVSVLVAGVNFATQSDVDTGTNDTKPVSSAKLSARLILPYDPTIAYAAGRYVEYSGALYKVASLTTPGDTPVSAPAKFTKIDGVNYCSNAEAIAGVVTTKAVAPSSLAAWWADQIVSAFTGNKALETDVNGKIVEVTKNSAYNKAAATGSQIMNDAGGDADKLINVGAFNDWFDNVLMSFLYTGSDPSHTTDANSFDLYKEKARVSGQWFFRFKSLRSTDARISLSDSDPSYPDRVTFKLGRATGVYTGNWFDLSAAGAIAAGFSDLAAPWGGLEVFYDNLADRVYFRGGIYHSTLSDTVDTVIATLDPALAPATDKAFVIYHESGANFVAKGIIIDSSGNVLIKGGWNQNEPIVLDGVSYDLIP